MNEVADPPPSADSTADRLAWVDAPGWLTEAACITAVTGMSADDVLAAFGVEEGAEVIEIGDVANSPETTVGVAAVNGGVVTVEMNGWQGARSTVLRQLSTHGRAAGASWNVEANRQLGLAEHGAELAHVSEGIVEQAFGARPSALAPLLRGLDPTSRDRPRAWMIQVIERFTGLEVGWAAVHSVARYHVVTPLLDDPIGAGTVSAGVRALDPASNAHTLGKYGLDNDELFDLVLKATPGQQRRFALWAAEQALQDAGLSDDPEIAAALERARQDGARDLPQATQVMLRRLAAQARKPNSAFDDSRDGVRFKRQFRAAEALREAVTMHDDYFAAVYAGRSAKVLYRDRRAEWDRQAVTYMRDIA